MIGILLITTAAILQVGTTSESAAAARQYVTAVSCAERVASSASFQRKAIYSIAEDAAKQCSAEISASARSLKDQLGKDVAKDPRLAREYVGAKARVAAWAVVIRRLESGEAVAVPTGLSSTIGTMQTRFVECSRSAGGIKFSSVFFGDTWLSKVRGRSVPEQVAAYRQVGRQSCPVSYRRLAEAVKHDANGDAAVERAELANFEDGAARAWLGSTK